MVCSKAEDKGGLTPTEDDNEAARHFIRRTLSILNLIDYKASHTNPQLKQDKIHERAVME